MPVCRAGEPRLLDVEGDLVRCVLYDAKLASANGQPESTPTTAPERVG
jgi:hypothetical protein